jgi:hypothetical protein
VEIHLHLLHKGGSGGDDDNDDDNNNNNLLFSLALQPSAGYGLLVHELS